MNKFIGAGEMTNTIRIIMMTAVQQPQMRSITTSTLIGPKFDSGDLMKEIIFDRRNVPMTRVEIQEVSKRSLKIGFEFRGKGKPDSSSSGTKVTEWFELLDGKKDIKTEDMVHKTWTTIKIFVYGDMFL